MLSTVLPLAEEMETRILALTRAGGPPEVFKALLEGSRIAAPRTAIFLVRQGQLKGWGSVGFDAPVSRRQRGLTLPKESGLLGQVLSGNSTEPVSGSSHAGNPDFGQEAPLSSLGVAIRVKGRPIAVVYAEQVGGGSSWLPPFLHSLVAIAGIRLELDLLRRKVENSGVAPKIAAIPTPEPIPAPTTAVALAEVDAAAGASQLDATLDAARRFARLVATDIRLYNEEAVVQGRQSGDLAQRLAEQLARGRETFSRRHGALGATGVQLLHEACVQVLASGDASLLPLSLFE